MKYIFLVFLSLFIFNELARAGDVCVTSKLIDDKNIENISIEFTVKNNSNNVVKIKDDTIPGFNVKGKNFIILMIQFPYSGCVFSDDIDGMVSDPVFGYTKIEPGKCINKTLNLNISKNFRNSIKESDVVVFWSCQLESEKKLYSRMSGWVLLPKH